MIKCHLSRLLGERRLKISEVARDAGVDRGTLTRLYHETAERVELGALNRICLHFDCSIGDLLEYIPEQKDEVR